MQSLIFLADLYNVSLDYLVGRSNIKANYKLDNKLEEYVEYCIAGYDKFIKKD